jgi:hypothetical protein
MLRSTGSPECRASLAVRETRLGQPLGIAPARDAGRVIPSTGLPVPALYVLTEAPRRTLTAVLPDPPEMAPSGFRRFQRAIRRHLKAIFGTILEAFLGSR